MQHTEFQASEPNSSEEEDFLKYFPMYFYGSTHDPLEILTCNDLLIQNHLVLMIEI
ncbi:MAG: hypothetical protein AB2693_16180 [Candidatus Thiodiazotropha sp.]